MGKNLINYHGDAISKVQNVKNFKDIIFLQINKWQRKNKRGGTIINSRRIEIYNQI